MLVYTNDVYPKLLSIREQTHEFIIYEMRQQARADNLTIIIVKNKLMSVVHVSVLLLINLLLLSICFIFSDRFRLIAQYDFVREFE